MAALTNSIPESRQTALVKSFGCRQAYESPRGRNPQPTGDAYGDFGLGLVSGMACPPPGSAAVDADGPSRLAAARHCRLGTRSDAVLSASMLMMDARGSVAGG